MTLGARIKERRLAAGLSQGALAGLVGAAQHTVSYWESGQKTPGDDVAATLADALEVSREWLETGKTASGGKVAGGIAFHPLANLFPLIEGPDFDALVAGMVADGFRSGEEIVHFEGKILDGRNRYRAAIAAGIIPPDAAPSKSGFVWPDHFREFGSEAGEWDSENECPRDTLAFVLSKNLHRRHLTASQRALLAARIADLPAHRPQLTVPDGTVKSDDAAAAVGVSVRSVRRARRVIETAEPQVVDAVAAGQVTVARAADMADLPPERQREILKAADPRVLAGVAAEARAQKTAAKKVRRAEREAGLAAKIHHLPGRKFGVFYADPEWAHEVWSDEGQQKAAVNHYPVSSLDAIKARLDTGFKTDIRADDAALFLWTTVPHLPQALEVMRAWGFEYKSQMVWAKDYPGERQGMGYWFRINHEILLVGTRGGIPCPAPGENAGSVLTAAPGRHSEKPAEAAAIIEGYFPSLPKIELNARAPRAGWTVVIHDPDAGQMVVSPDGEVWQ